MYEKLGKSSQGLSISKLQPSSNDFDMCLRFQSGKFFTKVDVRVNPEPSFDVIKFMGHSYQVSKLRDILFWKDVYAKKGVQKHIDDLLTLKTGVRPAANLEDDLPF